jgi:hypothetical protein
VSIGWTRHAKGDILLPQTGQGSAAREAKAARYGRSAWMCSTRASTGKRERIRRQEEGVRCFG